MISPSSRSAPPSLPHTFKTYATARVRLYNKGIGDANSQWRFASLEGVVVFGRNRSNLIGGEVAASIGHGAVESEKYWFKLYKDEKVLWVFLVPGKFHYEADKPFFHVFSASSGVMLGFRFDDDDEAAAFYKKVVDRTCPHGRSRPRALSAPKTLPTPRPRRVSTSMISPPQQHSFLHVAHAGINDNGVVETSKDIGPSWNKIKHDLSAYGFTKSICDEQLDFIEGYLVGSKAAEKTRKPSPAEKAKDESVEPQRRLRRKPVTKFLPNNVDASHLAR